MGKIVLSSEALIFMDFCQGPGGLSLSTSGLSESGSSAICANCRLHAPSRHIHPRAARTPLFRGSGLRKPPLEVFLGGLGIPRSPLVILFLGVP